MKHYVYKLDEIKTGEFYFGSRTCKGDIKDDTYMGSMKLWKPNKDNLIKTIIKDDFKTRDEATEYEKELIIEHYKNTLNKNYSIPNTGFYSGGEPETNPNYGKRRSEKWKDEQRIRMEEYYKTHPYSNKDKKFSKEWRNNISEGRIKLGTAKGKNNPRWLGSVKVTDLIGTIYLYEDSVIASNILGVTAHKLREKCKNNTSYQRGKYKGWKFEFI
jgi:hypothetical protein